MLRYSCLVLFLLASTASAHHTTPICDTEAGKILCTPLPDDATNDDKADSDQ
ncbi:MAG: hypothetical protein AAF965_11705 [Pseudomonadota bacterium]